MHCGQLIYEFSPFIPTLSRNTEATYDSRNYTGIVATSLRAYMHPHLYPVCTHTHTHTELKEDNTKLKDENASLRQYIDNLMLSIMEIKPDLLEVRPTPAAPLTQSTHSLLST